MCCGIKKVNNYSETEHKENFTKQIYDSRCLHYNSIIHCLFVCVCVCLGEGSPTVFWDFTGWKYIPQNTGKTASEAFLTPHCIKRLTPDAKFIVIFRNPTDRLGLVSLCVCFFFKTNLTLLLLDEAKSFSLFVLIIKINMKQLSAPELTYYARAYD